MKGRFNWSSAQKRGPNSLNWKSQIDPAFSGPTFCGGGERLFLEDPTGKETVMQQIGAAI